MAWSRERASKIKSMNLTDQITSLATSQRLKALGAPQQSYFYWIRDLIHNDSSHKLVSIETENGAGESLLKAHLNNKSLQESTYSAYSTTELGELLPPWSSSNKDHDGFWEAYPPALYGEVPIIHGEPTEVEVRAKLLIALYEKYPNYPDEYTPQEGILTL